MEYSGRKVSDSSSSPAGVPSSAPPVARSAYAAAGNLITFPGREKLDVRAPYMYQRDISARGKPHIKTGHFAKLSNLQRFQNGYHAISFSKIINGKEYHMQPDSTFQRQAWRVGIAYNEFNIVRGSKFAPVREKISHWGVYIRPLRHNNCPEPDIWHELGTKLWQSPYSGRCLGGPGEGKSGRWKKELADTEFQKITDPNFQEVTMYFSLEEFVLEGRSIGPLNEIISPNPGAAYSLAFANCQDFAKLVITSLKKYNWTDARRLNQQFSLSLLEKKMLGELEKEAEGRGEHNYRRAGPLLADER
ncbi:uncharacterized protein N7479_000113 [Penicillium vulpinum]|uniref:uncharacterized protein n=1 Tax=Penicillium vulpinum TaxID=29845 RepID=UPI002547544B|nr:uncharacterized protein N7479_000113 [Penicillium vulpinum]KAJ5970195.1 hypothetical protein N7479_000113 [Penicillium vulpinum]